MNPLNLIKVTECARSGCKEMGTKGCSACLKEFYCYEECQKADWKAHKILCNLIRSMPDTIVPSRDVCLIVSKVTNQTFALIAKLGRKKSAKLVEHTAAFAERQFGKRIEGKSYYEEIMVNALVIGR
jgi:hypothetical protein